MLSKYDISLNMIPYQASETSLFMSSIAQFNSLFDLFSPSQTLNILTFVMELLDERMEQYNVFPVSRMGHYLIVISGRLPNFNTYFLQNKVAFLPGKATIHISHR